MLLRFCNHRRSNGNVFTVTQSTANTIVKKKEVYL